MNFVNVSAIKASPVQNDERSAKRDRYIMEMCLKQNEDILHLTAQLALKDKRDKQSDELVAALEAQVTAQDKTIAALKAANTTGDKIDAASERELESFRATVKSYEASLTDAKKEIARWQGKAQFWKRVATFGILTVAVVSAAVGFVVLGQK